MAVTKDITDQGANLELVLGDSYLNADGTGIEFTESTAGVWPDLTGAGAAVNLKIGAFSKAGTIVTAGASAPQKVRFDITAAENVSAAFPDRWYQYQVYATFTAPSKKTLVTGLCNVRRF